MGLRAIDAVQKHSRFKEDTPENFAPYRIMISIAWYADDIGVAGVAHEHKKCPTINTIAERANVHRNTVMNWLPRLEESGELKVDHYGAGRGAHLVYTLLLPIDPVPLPDIGTSDYTIGISVQSDDVPISSHSDTILVQAIEEIKQLLVQQTAVLVQAMVQAIGTNGTSVQSDDVIESYDPSLDPNESRGESPTPLTPADARTAVIAKVCGLDIRIDAHRARCESAAVQLSRFKADDILERYKVPNGKPPAGWNWYLDDFRGRQGEQPTPEQVVMNISKQKQAATPRPAQGKQKDDTTDRLLARLNDQAEI